MKWQMGLEKPPWMIHSRQKELVSLLILGLCVATFYGAPERPKSTLKLKDSFTCL